MCDKKYKQRFHYWQILLTCYFVAVFLEKSFENYGVLGNSINFKVLAVLLVKPGSSFPNFGSNIQRI